MVCVCARASVCVSLSYEGIIAARQILLPLTQLRNVTQLMENESVETEDERREDRKFHCIQRDCGNCFHIVAMQYAFS